MKVLSVNVGLPRDVLSHGKIVRTGIFKSPVAGPVRARRLNLDGDEQADLEVHGGQDKAVYVYPSEHYAFWRQELPGIEFPWGMFGENLTMEGLVEADVRIGDRFAIGSAEFIATQPRMPCYKLGIRFNRPDMVKRFLYSGRTGWYLAVVTEGHLAAGDEVSRTARSGGRLTIAHVASLYSGAISNEELMREASELDALPEGWRDYFRRRLTRGTVPG